MNKNETIADIRKEAEARFRELLEKHVDRLGRIRAMQQFNQVFDRIEAAYRRECAEVREIAAATVLEDTKYVPANAAKLYKALKEAVICLRNGCDPDSCPTEEEIWNVIKECEAALAVPLRECDRFGSESEMRAAFIAWYNEAYDLKGSKDEIAHCDLKHDVDGILHEYIKWLFAPATEKKGD